MPGCGVHLLVAESLFDRLPVQNPLCRSALLLGSIAPDMGYFPLGDTLISDLAHFSRAGQLVRNLHQFAQDPVEQAFVLGWASHVLADVAIHPVINAAAGKRAGRSAPIAYADDPVSHIRVEQGLDAVVSSRFRCPQLPRFPEPLLNLVHRLVARTYNHLYDLELQSDASLRVAVRWLPGLLAYGRVADWWFKQGKQPPFPLGPGVALAQSFTRVFPSPVAFALAHPVEPSEELVSQVATLMAGLTSQLGQELGEGFASLKDFNLDTGELEGAPTRYPVRDKCLQELEHRRHRG